jgi:hypothetical protein
MVVNTGLEELCDIKDSAADMKSAVRNAMTSDAITTEEIRKRTSVLTKSFSNNENALQLFELIKDKKEIER